MPVSYDLGTAQGKIVIDYDGSGVSSAQAGVKGLGDETKKTTKTIDDFTPAIRNAGRIAAVAAGVIIGGFALAVKSATDFEFQMSAIQAVTQATTPEMEKLTDAALRIGKDTVFSASEAALAIEELGKSGISTTDILNGAADATVAIAAAGQIALPEAAQIASAALNQFKLKAEDLTDVADILAGAANASATGISEVGLALSFVGPQAKAAGVSFEDAATMIALFANNGIDGARAGTALRSMITDLAKPTKQAEKAMAELGLTTADGSNIFFDAQGNMKPMVEVVDLLRGAFQGLTAEQTIAYGTAIVGQAQVSALSAIVGTSAEQFDKLANAIKGTSAADVAAARLNNLQGQMEQLRGSMETAQILIGQILIPRLLELAQAAVAALDWFISLDEGTQNLIVNIGLVSAAILTFIAIAAKVVTSLQAMAAGMALVKAVQGGIVQGFYNMIAGMTSTAAAASVFTGVMGTLGGALTVAAVAMKRFTLALVKNPITLIVVAIAALIAAMIALYDSSAEFRALFVPLIEQVKALMEKLEPVFATIVKAVLSLVDSVITALVPVLTALAEAIVPIIELLVGILGPILEVVAKLLAAILGPALLLVAKLLEALSPVILLVLKAITPLINLLTDILVPVLDALAWVLGVVADALQVAADWVTEFFKASDDGTSQATEAWDAFVGFLTEVWTNVMAFLQPIINQIVGFFLGLYNTVRNVWMTIMTVVGTVIAWFQEHVVPVIDAVVALVTKLFHFLGSVVAFVWEGMMTNIQAFLDWWNTTVSPIIDTVVKFITDAFQFLAGVVSSVWAAIYGFIKDRIDAAWAAIQTVFGPIAQWFSDTFTPIIGIVTDIIDEVVSTITGIYDTVTSFFANVGDWLYQAGADLINGFINGIEDMLGGLTDILNGITDMIPEEKGPPSKDRTLLQPAGSLIMQGLINGIRNQIPELSALLGGITTLMPTNVTQALTGPAGGTSNSSTLNYYAADGSSGLSGEDELIQAGRRMKVVSPAWSS